MQGFGADRPLLLMGCGHMGHALAVGWLRAGLSPEHLYVVDPSATPDRLPGAKPGLARFADEHTLVISVAAGVPIDVLEAGVGVDATYVRAMPNTPAAIGAGITGLTGREDISAANKALARELLHAVGETVWIDRETDMNAVTAVSGSGPAYVFHLVECMAYAGAELGLDTETAMQLARQTVIGAARLMDEETEVSAGELRQRVTSPGGTTEAALKVLRRPDDGLAELMVRALSAAKIRGEALGG